jgi:hypothetical protein
MMNSNRLFRALVTALTVLACLWLLGRVHTRHVEPPIAHVQAQAPAVKLSNPSALPDSFPPVDVRSLPICAMDNTCFDGVPTDISCYTGMLSGGPAHEYRISVMRGQSLLIEAEPRNEDFDISFALVRGNRECVVGKDAAGPGKTERAVTGALETGVYRLVVGGYHDDCGPYLLTVREGVAPLAEVAETQTHTGRNGVVVRWTSFSEVDLTHYSLYRCTDAGRERIAVLRAHGGPASFADYRFTDRSPAARSTYQIEVVARDGRTELVPINS